MTIQLALDRATNDLIKLDGGGYARVSKGRYVVQAVRSKLQTELGEWLLDPTLGWLSLQDFEKGYDTYDIEDRARQIILGTEGVLEITSLQIKVSQRKLTLVFSAVTSYGVIDLTIPWG